MKKSILFLIVFAFNFTSNAQFPYKNPVVTTSYTADAAPKIMPDGKVWMVTSIDSPNGGGYKTMHSYRSYSSVDMVNWTDHGEILNITDLKPADANGALWAPDIIYYHGLYYLFYPVVNTNGTDVIGVAVSERMDKKFTIIQDRIPGSPNGLDPSIFIDDDGEKYMFWNRKLWAKVGDDMKSFTTTFATLNYGANNFMEAAWMHKRKGKYYYSYHTSYEKPVDKNNPDDPARKKSNLDYCMGNSATGSFTYKGTMNNELGVGVKNGPKYSGKDYVVWRLNQSNHGGIVEFHGQDYLFYHTSALSSYKLSNFENEGSWTQRSVCIDYLNYNTDGTIIPVKQTIECVAPVVVTQPFQIKLDLAAATKTNVNVSGQKLSFTSNKATLRFNGVNLGSGYYYLDLKVNESVGNAKVQVRLDSPTGTLCGTIRLNANSETENAGMIETFLREANGTHDVYLVFDLPGSYAQYNFESPRFYAGSPVANGDGLGNTRYQAEKYSAMSGIQTETTTDTGAGSNVSFVNNNDWCDYSINIASAGTYSTKFRVASAQNGGTIQIYKGTTLLGSVNIATTGGWQTWKTINGPSINFTSAGVQTIRLKFVNTSSTGYLFNINWFEVANTSNAKLGSTKTEEPSTNVTFDAYPNPANDQFTIDLSNLSESSLVKIFNLKGSLIYSQTSEPVKLKVNTKDWKSGKYFINVKTGELLLRKKIVLK